MLQGVRSFKAGNGGFIPTSLSPIHFRSV